MGIISKTEKSITFDRNITLDELEQIVNHLNNILNPLTGDILYDRLLKKPFTNASLQKSINELKHAIITFEYDDKNRILHKSSK